MARSSFLPPSTRREFLQSAGRGLGLLAFSRFAPSFLVNASLAATPAPEKDRSILVLVQLAGGNDGLNTLIPFADADYYHLRPTLGIAANDVLRTSDTLGLHPACGALHRLFHDGRLAIVQNVGYPNPNHSHFRSTEIWETASASDTFLSSGWVGRYLDNACAGAPALSHDPCAVHLTDSLPTSFMSAEEHPTFGLEPARRGHREREQTRRALETLVNRTGPAENDSADFLRHTLMDALVTEQKVQRMLGGYRPLSAYPESNFGESLRSVAALIAAGLPTRVYYVSLSGFDTHSNQTHQHANLLRTLSEGLAAFRTNAEPLGKQLDAGAERGRQVIAEVQRVSDDLRLLIGRADASSTRLEEAVARARRDEALLGAIEQRPAAERGQPVRAAEPEVSPEAAAFLSSLSGMR